MHVNLAEAILRGGLWGGADATDLPPGAEPIDLPPGAEPIDLPPGAESVDDLPPGAVPLPSDPFVAAIEQQSAPFAPEQAQLAPYATQEAADEAAEQDMAARVGLLLDIGVRQAPHARAGAYRLAEKTGLPLDTVKNQYDSIEASVQKHERDDVEWVRKNAPLARWLLDYPQLAPLVTKDKTITRYHADTRRYEELDWKEKFARIMSASIQPPGTVHQPGEYRVETEQRTYQDKSGLTGPAAALDVAARALKQKELAALGVDQLRLDLTDPESNAAWEGRERILRLKQELGNYDVDYGGSAIRRGLLTAEEALTGQSTSVGAMVGGAAVGVVARNPKAGMVTTKVLNAGLSFGETLGGSYNDYSSATDENGKVVDRHWAMAAAIIDAAVSTYIETASFGVHMQGLGPLGDAIQAGKGREWMKAALADKSKAGLWKSLAADVAKSAGSEAGEEGLQTFSNLFFGWLSRSASAGEAQSVDVAGAREEIVGAAGMGGLGGFIGIGSMQLGARFVSEMALANEAARSAADIRALTNVARGETAQGAPLAVADMIERDRRDFGQGITHLYVDPKVFKDVVAEAGADAEEVATELLGPDGPARVREANARRGTEPGQTATLEITVREYLERIGNKPIATMLADGMATHPGVMTLGERRLNQEAIVEEAVAYAEAEEPAEGAATTEAPTDASTVFEQRYVRALETQLMSTDRYQRKEARYVAKLHAAFIRTALARNPEAAKGMFQELTLSVQAAAPETPIQSEGLIRQQFEGMDPDAQTSAFFRDPNTQLLNERGLNVAPRDPSRPYLAQFDLEGGKLLNDELGHETLDGAYRAMAESLRAAGITDAGKSGGSVVAWVRDDAHARELAAAMRQAVDPSGRLAVTHATRKGLASMKYGLELVGMAHKSAKSLLGTRGELGHRKGVPSYYTRRRSFVQKAMEKLGLVEAPATPDFATAAGSPEARALIESAAADLAPRGAELSALKVGAQPALGEGYTASRMEDQDQFNRIYKTEGGLLSQAGMNEAMRLNPQPFKVSGDLRAFKEMNEAFGRKGTDAIAHWFEEILNIAGGGRFDAARPHGDEFFAHGKTREELDAFFTAVREITDDTTFVFEREDGSIVEQHGLSFAVGTAESLDVADRVALPAAKRAQDETAQVSKPRVYRNRDEFRRLSPQHGPQRSGSVNVGRLIGVRDQEARSRAAGLTLHQRTRLLTQSQRAELAQELKKRSPVAAEAARVAQRKLGIPTLPRFKSIDSAFDAIMSASFADAGVDASPSEQADSKWLKSRKGKGAAPGPFGGQLFEDVDSFLDFESDKRVSGLRQAFHELTKRYAAERGKLAGWEDAERAVDFLKSLEGLDKLRMPDDYMEFQIERDAAEQRSAEAEEWYGRIDKETAADERETDADTLEQPLYDDSPAGQYRELVARIADAEERLLDLNEQHDRNPDTATLVEIDKLATTLEKWREQLRFVEYARSEVFDQPAYHGSPTRNIEKEGFKLQKIGTGEGAQVYGWGMYFASKLGVAEWYRKKLSREGEPLPMFDGKPIDVDALSDKETKSIEDRVVLTFWSSVGLTLDRSPMSTLEAIDRVLAEQWQRVADAQARIDKAAQWPNDPTVQREAQELRDLLPEMEEFASTMDRMVFEGRLSVTRRGGEGQTYKAEVPEDHELLDRDKAIANQPGDVFERIEALVRSVWGREASRVEHPRKAIGSLLADTGEGFYRSLSQKLGGPEAASRALMDAGIPGLRYLDGSSRGAGEGSHNYVIWDEGRMPIVETLYQPKPTDPPLNRWFNDSKVVNEDGDPRRVFHGSSSAGFDVFDPQRQDKNALFGPGFYFTEDPDIAGTYVEKGGGDAPAVYPAYLKIENPFDADATAAELLPKMKAFRAKPVPPELRKMFEASVREDSNISSPEGFRLWADNTEWAYNRLLELGVDGGDVAREHFDWFIERAVRQIEKDAAAGHIPKGKGFGEEVLGYIGRNVFIGEAEEEGRANIRDVLERLGFDGITHTGGGRMGDKPHKVWIAFESTQVKSASGNRGTFDPDDPSIVHQPGKTDKRGFVEITQDHIRASFKIFLTEQSDMSTVLHELGHTYLRMLGQLSKLAESDQSLKDDYAKALKWMGVEEGGKIEVEHEEKWARAFEAYLLEGKAPSTTLTEAFSTFARWLKGIYQTIASLNVPIDDEIRGVFDRLLATDAEIKRVKQKVVTPMWDSPEQAGMDPEEWRKWLDAQRKLDFDLAMRTAKMQKEAQLRAAEAFKTAEFRKLQAQAEDEWEQRPDVQASEFIRKGQQRNEDGSYTVNKEFGILDSSVADTHPGLAKKLKGRLREFGVHPGYLAERWGFRDGKAALDAIEALPKQKDWVRARAEELMREKHPEIDGEIADLQQAILQLVHDESNDDDFLRDLVELDKRAGSKGTPVESVRLAAARDAANGRAGRIALGTIEGQEKQAADEAMRFAAQKDWERARVAKRRQIYFRFLWRETQKAKDDREKFLKLAQQLAGLASRRRLGKAGLPYRDVVDTLVESLGIVEEREQEVPRESLQALVAAMEANGDTIAFDPDLVGKLLVEPTGWRDLTIADMRLVHAALANISEAATHRNIAVVDGKKFDREIIIDQLLAEAEASTLVRNMGPLTSSEAAAGLVEKGLSTVASVDAYLLKPQTMLAWLGNESIDSIWHRAIVKPLQQAKHRQADLMKRVVRPVVEVFEKVPPEVKASLMDPVNGKALFRTHRDDLQAPTRRFELLMMALHRGTDSSIERLTEGREISLQDVDAALGMLTRAELEWVQSVWDAAESLWPESRALEERDNGVAPPKLDAVAFTIQTADGPVAMRGGYFPAVYDRRATTAGEKQAAQTIADLMDPSYTRPGTSRNHLKSRVDNFADALSLDPTVIQGHLLKVTHDIAYREVIRSVGGLMLDPKIKKVLTAKLGDERARVFLQWLKDIGRMEAASTDTHAGKLGRLMRMVRNNMVVGTLGYAVDNFIADYTNVAVAPIKSGVKAWAVAKGVASVASDYKATRELALAKSGEMRARESGVREDFDRQIKSITKAGHVPARALRWFRDHGFWVAQQIDNHTSTAVWYGAYRQALDGGRADADAVEFADVVIQQTFPSHHVVDKSAIQRDKGAIGSAVAFYGYMNVLYNLHRRIVQPVIGARGAKATSKAAAKAFGQTLALAVTANLLAEFIMGRGPEDDDGEDEAERWMNWMLRKFAVAHVSTVPLIGGMFESMVLGKEPSIRSGPAFAVLDAIGRAAWSAWEKGELTEKVMWEMVRAAGLGFGVPVRPIRWIQGVVDMLDGDQPDALDGVADTIFGDRPDDPRNLITAIPRAME